MEIKTMSVPDLLSTIWKLSKRPDNTFSPAFMLWLGAGASRESGIPLAFDLAAEALRDKFAEQAAESGESLGKMSVVEIYERAKLEGYCDPENTKESSYAQIMRTVLRTPSERRFFLRRVLEKAEASDGYRILGGLLRRNVFDTVLTTNFDDLVKKSADPVLPLSLIEVSSNDQYRHLASRVEGERRLVRLHGDFGHAILRNTAQELEKTPALIYKSVKTLFNSYGMILIGYGGQDVHVMRRLLNNKLWRDSYVLQPGLFWCDVKKAQDLAPLVKDFLREEGDRAYYVRIEGFDTFMLQLAEKLGVDLPRSKIERDLLESLGRAWNWLDFLAAMIDGSDTSLSLSQQRYLEQLVKLVGADRAVLATLACGSTDWNISAVAGPPLPAADNRALTASLHQLRGGADYAIRSHSAMSPDNVFYNVFESQNRIEVYSVCREDELTALIAFASGDRPLIPDRQRLIRAAVKLLVSSHN